MRSIKSILSDMNKAIRQAAAGIFAPRSLKKEVDKLAKRANRRLQNLEVSGLYESSLAYGVVQRKSYDRSPGYTMEGTFRRDVQSMSKQELLAEKEELQKFLGAKTSKVRGYKKSLKQSYKTFKERYGSGMSFSEYQRFWKSGATSSFGYTEVLKAAARTGKSMTKVLNSMEKLVAENEALKAATGQRLGELNIANRIMNE